jgi:hypothetical protein
MMASKFGGIPVDTPASKFGGVAVESIDPLPEGPQPTLGELEERAYPEQYQLPPAQEQELQGFGDRFMQGVKESVGRREAGLSALTGATTGVAGQFLGSAEGIAREILSGEIGSQEAANRIEQLALKRAEQMTYEPRTQAGREVLGEIGEMAEPLQSLPPYMPGGLQASRLSGPAARQAVTSPERSARVDILRTARPDASVDQIELLAKSNAPDAPQKMLEALEEANAAGVDHPTIKRLTSEVSESGDTAKARDIIEADRRKAISAEAAEYELKGPRRARKSKTAKTALDLGFTPSEVQLFAGSSKASKDKFREILRRAREAEKDELAKQEIHPQAVVGDSFAERLNAVDKINKEAGSRIDEIAKRDLGNIPIDLGEPLSNFKTKLDNLGIVFSDGNIDYSRSALRGMPEYQKQINTVIEQLSPQGMPNATAYDAHILKQWFDNQINYGKSTSGAGGIPPKVENAIKALRRDVNTELGKLSPEYKKVNTQYSETIDALNNLKALAGRNTNLQGEFIDESLGMLAKRITSNAMSRARVKDSIKELENVASKYGVTFNDDIASQVAAVNALEKKLGSFSDTSLKGQVGVPISEAVGAVEQPISDGVRLLDKAFSKKKKINNEAFIKALEDLLNEQ